MNTRLTVLVTVLALGYGTVGHAEGGEGNGDPFPFRSGGQLTSGNPFVSETGQTDYPQPRGNTTQPSTLAVLAPAFGAEALVHTSNSLPLHANEGMVAYTQGKSLERAAAAALAPAPVREVGGPRPRGIAAGRLEWAGQRRRQGCENSHSCRRRLHRVRPRPGIQSRCLASRNDYKCITIIHVAFGRFARRRLSPMERRCAAILVADIAGYSRLTERFEQETHDQLMSLRERVIQPAVASHRGEVVKRTGDGFLALFAAAQDSIDCAIAIQDGAALQEARLPADRAIRFRMGIACGEIIIESDDVYGNEVNIAARLQNLAEPGTVLISSAVRDCAGPDRTAVMDLGLVALRNMDQPVQAFRIGLSEFPRARRTSQNLIARPSIAVLPFHNLDGNPASAYFAAGIAEEIITSLASLRELNVASHASTAALDRVGEPGGPIPDIDYVLSGTIRRSPSRIRVTTKLTHLASNVVEWAHRYDLPVEDIFDIQDQITERTVQSIAPQINRVEIGNALRKRPDSMTAHDHLLQALQLIYRLQRDDFDRAGALLRRAIALDDGYAAAYALAAEWHGLRVGQGWSPNVIDDSKEAIRLAEAAVDRDSSNALALAILGHHRAYLFGEYDIAMALFDRALAANPGSARAWGLSAPTFSYIGRPEAAITRAQQALRLSPLDPCAFWYRASICIAHYTAGDYEAAIQTARATLAENGRYTTVWRTLTAALAALARYDEARAAAAQVLAIEPTFKAATYVASYPYRSPILRERLLKHLVDGGLPS